MSKEKPILFNTEMVRAILEGRKRQTRRVIPELIDKDAWLVGRYRSLESPPGKRIMGEHFTFRHREDAGAFRNEHIPLRYSENDVLWVRETWFREDCTPDCAGREDENECPFNRVGNACYGYKAQYLTGGDDDIKWRPSIHMPKEAARIFLRVTDVRVERVQDMPLFDVWDEGTPQMPGNLHSDGAVNQWDFRYLWDSLNAKRGYGWDSNPWVWVYSFERVDKPAGWPGREGGE